MANRHDHAERNDDLGGVLFGLASVVSVALILGRTSGDLTGPAVWGALGGLGLAFLVEGRRR